MRKTEALLTLGFALVIGSSDLVAQSGGRHIRIRKDASATAPAMDTTAYVGHGTNGFNGANNLNGSRNPNGSTSLNDSTGLNGSNGVASNNGTTDTTTTEYSGGEVALAPEALPPGMTDANILAHLASGDSLEIRMAQMALTQAQDPRVRTLAQTILDDHTHSLQQGLALAQQNGITPQPAPGDTAAQRMMRMMDRMSSMTGSMGARFDTMFVRRQVMMHQRTLDQLQQLRSVAQSGAVRQQIDATIPVIQKHLDAARQLAQEMGIDTSMRGMRGMNGMGGMNDMRGMRGTASPNGTGTVNGTNGANYPNGTTNTNGMPVSPPSPNGTGSTNPHGDTRAPGSIPAPGTPGSAGTTTGTKPPTI